MLERLSILKKMGKRLDGFLEFNGNEILIGAGEISIEETKLYAELNLKNIKQVKIKYKNEILIES